MDGNEVEPHTETVKINNSHRPIGILIEAKRASIYDDFK